MKVRKIVNSETTSYLLLIEGFADPVYTCIVISVGQDGSRMVRMSTHRVKRQVGMADQDA